MADITHQIDNEASSQRPDNFIVGVIDEQPQVESAVNELNSLGLPEDAILVLHGERGLMQFEVVTKNLDLLGL